MIMGMEIKRIGTPPLWPSDTPPAPAFRNCIFQELLCVLKTI